MAQIGFEPISRLGSGNATPPSILVECQDKALFWKPKSIPYNVTVSESLLVVGLRRDIASRFAANLQKFYKYLHSLRCPEK
jgi:hypothetical protein